MGSLKDNISQEKTVTLSTTDIYMLNNIHNIVQSELDRLQQVIASSFLQHIAVEKFGCNGDDNLQFSYDPSKESDNLTIRIME